MQFNAALKQTQTIPAAPPPTARNSVAEPIVFRKGASRWVFACEPGEEQALLAHVARLAADRTGGFDQFDAALVGHQVRQRLNADLDRAAASAPTTGTGHHAA